MNVIILGGFLGSGKTTFLLQLVPYLTMQCRLGKEYPVVVLENEISATDVDTKLLQSRKMTVRNLTSGCICCTSSGQMIRDVDQIQAEYQPEYLVIEATGMAYPDLIRENLQKILDCPIRIAALADAKRWNKLSAAMPLFAIGQLSQADAVYLNKMDLTEKAVLDQIVFQIKEQFPGKPIFCISACNGVNPELFAPLCGKEHHEKSICG